MDAQAYLKSHGWKGEGHSLDHRGLGIRKPLLVTHKRDLLGLGKKTHKQNVSDQWWMRAFDDSLKTIGTGQESALAKVRKEGINRGGLYGFFVKGESLVGTIPSTTEESTPAAESFNSSVEHSHASTPRTSTAESDSSINEGSASNASDESDSESESSSDEDLASEMFDDMKVDSAPAVQPAEQTEPAEHNGSVETKGLKRKRKETAEETRRRRKELKAEKARIEAVEKREKGKEKAIAAGTYNEEDVRIDRIIADINVEVNKIAKRNAAMGRYGPILPHPSTLKKSKVDKNPSITDPVTGKKISYKDAKINREKAMREAKKVIKAEVVERRIQKGDLPNPNNYSGQEWLDNYTHELTRRQKEKRQNEARLKAIKLEEKNARRAQRKLEKSVRKEEQKEEREAFLKEIKKRKGQMKEAAKVAAEAAAAEAPDAPLAGFENGTDVISLAEPEPESGKKLKSIPGYGQMEKYPSKKDKKLRKLHAEAFKLGMSLDDYEKKVKADADKAKIEEKLRTLSAEEKAKYEERAAEKEQSLEEYVLRRVEKKEKRRAKQQSEKSRGESADQVKSESEEKDEDDDVPGFIVDAEGDLSLGFVVDTEGDKDMVTKLESKPTSNSKPSEPLPVDPAIWEGKPVKSLTKAERQARLNWMRERRAERRVARGLPVKNITKGQRKMEMLRRTTGEVIKTLGKPKSELTKQDVNLARRRARKQLKEEKRERKGKESKLVLNKKGRHRVSERAKERNRLAVATGANAS